MNTRLLFNALTPARVRRPQAAASFDRDARIGVIGAGAAGLTVARSLVQKGFRHVTVLEREGRVGGKCSTFLHEGHSYELGAVLLTPFYSNLGAVAKELGITTPGSARRALLDMGWYRGALTPPFHVDVDQGRATILPPILHDQPLHRIAASCARLGGELMRYRSLREPGLLGIPKETCVPFDQWARERGVTETAHLIAGPLFTAVGYGYLAQAPAAYVLKILATVAAPPLFELFEGGYQGLWEAVARGIDVRCNVTVRSVQRAERVTVETDSERLTFDALVLTSPIDEAISFLDATAAERELSGKLAYIDYRVVVASAVGLPDHRFVAVPKHFEPDTRGEVLLLYKRWKETDVYTFYTYGREGTSMEDTVARVEETARRLGGAITRVHRTKKWRYFPHVSCQDMASGFYERFDEIQGVRHTYYAGEQVALGLVESVVSQARDLVDRHFAVAHEGPQIARGER